MAATSVGIVEGVTLLDLAYEEDSQAEVDMNVVMTEAGGFVEVQATAERTAFPREKLLEMMDHAQRGIIELFEIQRAALRAVNGWHVPHRSCRECFRMKRRETMEKLRG